MMAHETPVKTANELTAISEQTYVQRYAYLRDVCSHHLVQNRIQIGRPGEVVQVDKTLISQRKNNQGRILTERWVFCGVDVSSKMCFMQFVPDRNQETLLPIIERLVRPGTLILSDEWRAYTNIPNIPGETMLMRRSTTRKVLWTL